MELSISSAIFLIVYLCLAMVNIIGRYRESDILNHVTKPFLMPALILVYLSATNGRFSPLIAIALGFDTLGDIFLMLRSKKGLRYLLIGMAFFMVGHLCYFAWFVEKSLPIGFEIPWLGGVLTTVLLTVWFWRTMAHSGHPYRKGLSAYCIVIDLIIIGALLTWGKGPYLGTILCVAGTLLFCLSDFLIAMEVVGKRMGDHCMVMITYILAQLLLICGFVVLS